MDTSETYVRMSDCPEIQGHRKKQKDFQLGDFVANYEEYKIKKYVGIEVWDEIANICRRGLATWLPRQDQIQEMLDCDDMQIAHHRLYQLHEFWMGRDLKSLEQLWLAFYMQKKHGKVWDGEKWTKK